MFIISVLCLYRLNISSLQPFMSPRYPGGPRPGVRMPQQVDFNVSIKYLINKLDIHFYCLKSCVARIVLKKIYFRESESALLLRTEDYFR